MLNQLKSLHSVLFVAILIKAAILPNFADVAAILALSAFMGFKEYLVFKKEEVNNKALIEEFNKKFEEYKSGLESYRIETAELRREVKSLVGDQNLKQAFARK